jgi:hypothetical protein
MYFIHLVLIQLLDDINVRVRWEKKGVRCVMSLSPISRSLGSRQRNGLAHIGDLLQKIIHFGDGFD